MARNEFEARLAREIQQSLLPNIPQFEGFEFGGAMHPLNSAGGDFFDFITMRDGSLGIVIGDVAGHGVGPAMLMATTRAYLRALARTSSDIGEILTLVNRMLCDDANGRFVTLFFAKLDCQRFVLTYANAGHGMVWRLRQSGDITPLCEGKASGLPLGVVPDYEYSVFCPMTMKPGDIFFSATDGLIECPNAMTKELFGFDPVIEIIQANREKAAQDIVGIIFAAAHFVLLRQEHRERASAVKDVSSLDGFHEVVEKYADIKMMADDMTAVIIKVT